MSGFAVDGNISATAVATAHFRALETTRPDRLIEDRLASVFVAASGIPMSEVGLSQVVAGRVYESVVARSRYLDRCVEDAVAAGIEQIVLLGAGLDARAWRLDLPTTAAVYEVDLPGLFDFKEAVVAGSEFPTTCRRVVVRADVTEPVWSAALTEAGFDPAQRTVWIAEGLLIYLTAEQNAALLADVTSLSATGSTFGFVHFGPGSLREAQSRQLSQRVEQAGYGFQSRIDSPRDWLPETDWDCAQLTIKEYADGLGRTIPYDEQLLGPVAWLGCAVRLGG